MVYRIEYYQIVYPQSYKPGMPYRKKLLSTVNVSDETLLGYFHTEDFIQSSAPDKATAFNMTEYRWDDADFGSGPGMHPVMCGCL